MMFFISEVIILIIIFFLEDLLTYRYIKKIDKKEREFVNNWEIEHITRLENLIKEREKE